MARPLVCARYAISPRYEQNQRNRWDVGWTLVAVERDSGFYATHKVGAEFSAKRVLYENCATLLPVKALPLVRLVVQAG